MSKLVFLDVDGTLCDLSGKVPESARQAIKIARDNGHKIYICTGRSKPEITEEIISVGLDGIIGAGGGYILDGEKVLLHLVMKKDDVISMIEFFDENNIGYYLESNQGLFGSQNFEKKVQEVMIELHGIDESEKTSSELKWFYDLLKVNPKTDELYGDINKISFVNNTVPFEEIYDKFFDKYELHRATIPQFGKDSGEIGVKGCNKKTAIELLLKELKFDKNDTIAYGDGLNDIDMFNAVGYKVAMDNAADELKKISDEVTERAEENGIYNSFKKNGLI